MAKKEKTSLRDNIPLQWKSLFCDPQFNNTTTDSSACDISVFSRKLKGIDQSPSNVLFRTHNYDFTILPNAQLLQWAGRDNGFHVTLTLFKRATFSPSSPTTSTSTTTSTTTITTPTTTTAFDNEHCNHNKDGSNSHSDEEFEQHFSEFTCKSCPVISYQYQERVREKMWCISLEWPSDTQNWRGEFCFKLDFFRTVNEHWLCKFMSVRSGAFTVYSKPEVFLKQLEKQQQQQTQKSEKKSKKSEIEETARVVVIKSEVNHSESDQPNKKKKKKTVSRKKKDESSSSSSSVSNKRKRTTKNVDNDDHVVVVVAEKSDVKRQKKSSSRTKKVNQFHDDLDNDDDDQCMDYLSQVIHMMPSPPNSAIASQQQFHGNLFGSAEYLTLMSPPDLLLSSPPSQQHVNNSHTTTTTTTTTATANNDSMIILSSPPLFGSSQDFPATSSQSNNNKNMFQPFLSSPIGINMSQSSQPIIDEPATINGGSQLITVAISSQQEGSSQVSHHLSSSFALNSPTPSYFEPDFDVNGVAKGAFIVSTSSGGGAYDSDSERDDRVSKILGHNFGRAYPGDDDGRNSSFFSGLYCTSQDK